MNRCTNCLTDGQTICLSKVNSDCLKGVFAIFVLIHHLYQHSGLFHHSLIGTGLQFLGYFSVGVFFFLSGYGLMQSYRKKGSAYLCTFPKKRLLPFYAMMLPLIVIYCAYTLIIGDTLEVAEVVQSFLFGGTVISKGWYLQVQLLCYIIFYFALRLCKKQSTALYTVTLLTFLYGFIMIVFDKSMSWYVSTPLFTVGLWFACYKENIDQYLLGKGKWLLTFFASGVLLVAMLLGHMLAEMTWLKAVCLTISECAFVFCVLLAMSKIRVDYTLTRLLGAISLEVYVMQGLCLSFFHSDFVNIQNPYLYVAAVCVSTIILAVAIHPIIKWIFSLCGGNRGGSNHCKIDKVSK